MKFPAKVGLPPLLLNVPPLTVKSPVNVEASTVPLPLSFNVPADTVVVPVTWKPVLLQVTSEPLMRRFQPTVVAGKLLMVTVPPRVRLPLIVEMAPQLALPLPEMTRFW